jgi:hypothetical protein
VRRRSVARHVAYVNVVSSNLIAVAVDYVVNVNVVISNLIGSAAKRHAKYRPVQVWFVAPRLNSHPRKCVDFKPPELG